MHVRDASHCLECSVIVQPTPLAYAASRWHIFRMWPDNKHIQLLHGAYRSPTHYCWNRAS